MKAIFVLVIAVFNAICFGQEPPLKVHVYPTAPFVMVRSDATDLSGFDIDLWKAIADEADLKYEFVLETTFSGMLKSVQDRNADLALSSITITQSREASMDFSHAYLPSGLQLMARKSASAGLISNVQAVWEVVKNPLFYFMIFVIAAGVLAWVMDFGADGISDKFFPGIFEGIYFVVVTMSTVGYGDLTMKKPIGRIFAMALILIGITFFSVITAKLASVMTVSEVSTATLSPETARGKAVATVKGTTSVAALQDLGCKSVLFDSLEGCYDALLTQKVDAVLYDAPTQRYFVQTEGAGRVELAGRMIEPQSYGIAMQENSPYRERINRALLKVMSNGVYAKLHLHYFGR